MNAIYLNGSCVMDSQHQPYDAGIASNINIVIRCHPTINDVQMTSNASSNVRDFLTTDTSRVHGTDDDAGPYSTGERVPNAIEDATTVIQINILMYIDIDNEGGGGSRLRPPYYALCYIMKSYLCSVDILKTII